MPSTRFPQLSRVARRCVLAAALMTSLVAASCSDDDSPTVEDPPDDASAVTTTTTTAPTSTTAPTTESTSAEGPAPGQQYRLTIEEFAYKPNPITIKPGVIVAWVNKDSVAHTITHDGGEFDTELNPGRGFGRTFGTPGTFNYHCKIHPSMTGTITVQS